MKKTKEELQRVHPAYSRHVKLWRLYMAAYKGIEAIVRGSYIPQHEREPDGSYNRRISELYSFAYSKSVTGIFTYHLMNKPPVGRTLKELDTNEFWQLFFKDSNLMGDSYDTVIAMLAKNASIQGHMGVLVDKSPKKFLTLTEQKKAGVYPYIAAYHPPAILDWQFSRDENHRPYLSYLKLLEDDGRLRIWTKDEWAVFKIDDMFGTPMNDPEEMAAFFADGSTLEGSSNKQTGGKAAPNAQAQAVQAPGITAEGESLESETDGINELGMIPFLWLYNQQSNVNGIGESDLNEISRLDISLIKNASQIEEVINFAAFPMMVRPKRDAKPNAVASENQDDEVSVQSVIEYDPEYPESKPEWLTPEVQSSIDSILKHMEFKVGEIYRAANIGGLAGTQVSTVAKSGVALKSEFQILNSVLVSKATNLEKAENRILELWLKWEGLWEKLGDKVHFGRSKSFNVEDVATDLDNALTATQVVWSKTFQTLLQQQVATQVLPSMSEDEKTAVDQEIEDNVETGQNPVSTGEIDNLDEDDTGVVEEGMEEE